MASTNPFREKIVARAVKDEAFRQELLNDPKSIVSRELDVTIPDEFNILVLEDTPTTFHIVLPPDRQENETRELSDEELEAAAGGKGPIIITWTAYCEIPL